MALGGLSGELGLTLIVLVHLAYTAYENRRGTVARLNKRLKAVGTVLYRLSQDHDGVDEEAVRREVLANGGDSSVLPSDFDDAADAADDDPPDRGGHPGGADD